MPDPRDFDPGYFGPAGRSQLRQEQALSDRKRFFRRPGLDAGTFLWPLLFCFVHIFTATMVQLPVLAIRVFSEMARLGHPIELTQQEMTSYIQKDFAISAAIYSVIQIAIYLIFLFRREKREHFYFLKAKPRALDWLRAFFAALGALGVAIGWMVLLNNLRGHLGFVDDMLKGYEQIAQTFQGEYFVMNILSLSILVPAAEELLFRGIVLAEMRRVMKPWAAVLVSALIFAIFHFNVVQSSYVFVAGLILGMVYICTDSIFLSIFVHMVYNFGGSIVPMMLQKNEGLLSAVNIFYVCMIPVGALMLWWIYKTRRPVRKPEPAMPDPAGFGSQPQYPNGPGRP